MYTKITKIETAENASCFKRNFKRGKEMPLPGALAKKTAMKREAQHHYCILQGPLYRQNFWLLLFLWPLLRASKSYRFYKLYDRHHFAGSCFLPGGFCGRGNFLLARCGGKKAGVSVNALGSTATIEGARLAALL